MTERGHDSNQPLLQKNDGKRNLSTRLKISLFAFLGGVAIEMRSISQTQFVYSYLKNHADINNTVSTGTQTLHQNKMEIVRVIPQVLMMTTFKAWHLTGLGIYNSLYIRLDYQL